MEALGLEKSSKKRRPSRSLRKVPKKEVEALTRRVDEDDPSLTAIDLKDCDISSKALDKLVMRLAKNTHVTSLDISNTQAGSNTIKTIVDHLKAGCSLTSIDMRNVGLLEHTAWELKNALVDNLTLTHIRLGEQHVEGMIRDSELSSETKAEIYDIVRANKSLQDVVQSRSPKLRLCKRKLTQFILAEDMFTFITHLDVSYNRFTALPVNCTKCRELVSLNISNNRIQSLPADLGECLPNLTELIVAHNVLRSLPASIGCMVGLQSLDASHNQLQELGELGAIIAKELTCLTLLNLEGNGVRDISEELVAEGGKGGQSLLRFLRQREGVSEDAIGRGASAPDIDDLTEAELAKLQLVQPADVVTLQSLSSCAVEALVTCTAHMGGYTFVVQSTGCVSVWAGEFVRSGIEVCPGRIHCILADTDMCKLWFGGADGFLYSSLVLENGEMQDAKKHKGHSDAIMCITKTGNVIVTGSADETLRVWDNEKGKCRKTVKLGTMPRCVARKRDCMWVGGQQSISRFDLKTWKLKDQMDGHHISLAFQGCGGNIFVSSSDKSLKIFKTKTAECWKVIPVSELGGTAIALTGNPSKALGFALCSPGNMILALHGEKGEVLGSIDLVKEGVIEEGTKATSLALGAETGNPHSHWIIVGASTGRCAQIMITLLL